MCIYVCIHFFKAICHLGSESSATDSFEPKRPLATQQTPANKTMHRASIWNTFTFFDPVVALTR